MQGPWNYCSMSARSRNSGEVGFLRRNVVVPAQHKCLLRVLDTNALRCAPHPVGYLSQLKARHSDAGEGALCGCN
jgi:hypothetical protein